MRVHAGPIQAGAERYGRVVTLMLDLEARTCSRLAPNLDPT